VINRHLSDIETGAIVEEAKTGRDLRARQVLHGIADQPCRKSGDGDDKHDLDDQTAHFGIPHQGDALPGFPNSLAIDRHWICRLTADAERLRKATAPACSNTRAALSARLRLDVPSAN